MLGLPSRKEDVEEGHGVLLPRPLVDESAPSAESVPAAGESENIVRTIDISRNRFGQAAEHIRDAIEAGQPDVLTINRAGADANRAAATGGLPKVPGMHLDEYPPAMFEEGGAGASVRAINPGDNKAVGAYIGACCRTLPDGSKIRIRVGE